MPSVFDQKHKVAAAAVSVSVVAASVAAYLWYNRKQNKSERALRKLLASSQQALPDIGEQEPVASSSSAYSQTTAQAQDMPQSRGGRVNYRAQQKRAQAIACTRQASLQTDQLPPHKELCIPPSLDSSLNSIDEESRHIHSHDQSQNKLSWSDEVERAAAGAEQAPHYRSQSQDVQTELRLSEQLQTKCTTTTSNAHSQTSCAQTSPKSAGEEEEEVVRVLSNKPLHQPPVTRLSHPQPIGSPSLNSETSVDSGQGGSATTTSPVEELLPIYDIEIPQDIVGLIIGKKGSTIKDIQEKTGAHMMIRHHYEYKDGVKICSIEGSRDQINCCLRVLRRRFPPCKFPHFNLKPILPAALQSPVPTACETMTSLSLPLGVGVECAVSALVDVGHFFVQQPTHPSFSSLNRLDTTMLALYSQEIGIPSLPKPIEKGVLCAAPAPPGWYRATTVHVDEENDEVLVKFLDYGPYMKMPSCDLKQIRSDFMSLPFQAVECFLANVQPVDAEGWSSEAMELFSRYAMTCVVEVKVLGYDSDNVPLVEVYNNSNLEDFAGQSLNSLLVESGLAHWIGDESLLSNSTLEASWAETVAADQK